MGPSLILVYCISHCLHSLQSLDSQLSHYAHLRTLDLSYNRLQTLPSALPRSLWDFRRIVFINNTLPGLQILNLSYNRFWTVPTNMPHNLETIDLSHNFLVQILPGSLDRLSKLNRFFLHNNKFSWLHEGVFEKLSALEIMSLGDNPWACEEEENMTKLLKWAEQTRAAIFGCPCYTKPVCGRSQLKKEKKRCYPLTPTLFICSILARYIMLWLTS
uniref:Oligodendrocyte myelin glycoprotein b n=1 Tax=Periophthalmus magnuspinnatus TaxID=409849 RepID=A0A3B4B7D4_9GOBI